MKSGVSGRRVVAGMLATFLFLSFSTAFADAGRTVGTFAVAPDGAATYTIPIWAPPGPQGVQPSMALIYDSHGGDGPEGVGWTLAGLSSIARCNLTVAQDGTAAGITLTYADRFCIDGKRLRLTGSENLATYGDDGTTYQTEVADFSNVTAHGTAGNGPDYFTVQGRNGWTYEYGNTTDSLILGNGTAFAWMLDKVTDRDGNAMVITWEPASANLAGTTVPESIQWTPSSHGYSTYNYKMEFNYQTLTLAVKAGYLAGQPVENFYSLTSIQIESSGSTVKDYFLSYTPSGTTGRQTLTKLTECADSTQTDCLTPTTFAYQPGGAGLQGATTLTSSSSVIGTPVAIYDFDGDGRNDLAWYQNGTWQVAFATSSGYSAPVSTGVTDPNALKDSVDGSGTDGFLAQQSGTWWWYKWNGSTFAGTNTKIAIDTSVPGSNALADVDGDGLPDLITRHSDGYLYVRLNASIAGSVTFSSSPIKTIANTAQPISSGVGTRRADFSGTGQQDIFLTTFTKQGPFIEALQFTGTTFVNTQEFFGSPGDVADYNDDGCSDLLLPTDLILSACNGSPAQTIPLSQSAVAGLDWDGDGRRDVLVNNGGTLGVYLSIGTKLSTTLISTGIPYSTTSTYTVAHNATGDGLDALVVTSGSAPYTIQYYLHKGAGQQADLLNSVTDGYGNTITPTYTSIVQGAYSNYFIAPAYPYELYLAPIYVVSNATFSDPTNPPNGTYSQSYSYIGSWRNMQGRGFSNFINVDMHDSRNNVWQHECFENKFPFSGMQACTRLTLDQAGTQVFRDQFGNHAENTLDGTQNNQRYLIYYNWTDKKYQLSWSESSGNATGPLIETDQTNYQYDDVGNQTSVIVARTDNDSNSPYLNDTWTTTVSNTVEAPDTSTWCVDLLSTSQVSYTASDGSPTVTINRQYTPDEPPHCRYREIETQPSTAYQVTEDFGYDDFGNINTDTVTGTGRPPRVTSADWGTTGQFAMSVTDASTATTHFNYNFNLGLISSETDPNGLPTSWNYDGFGRLSQETRPDGDMLGYAYESCAPGGCPTGANGTTVVHWTESNPAGGLPPGEPSGFTYFDQLDRPIVWQTPMLGTGGPSARKEIRYDNLGRIAQRAAPCAWSSVTTPCSFWTTMSYDDSNRLTQVQRPVSQSDSRTLQATSYAYAGDTTTITDPNNHTRTLMHDVTGSLTQATDAQAPGYSVFFGYDAAGSRTSVTDGKNTLWTGTYAYGIAPFLVGETDIDRGNWGYTVDPLGERTAWTDPKGQHFYESYDSLSRPLTRTEPDLFTQWTWGSSAASDNIGQLASVCTGTGSACSSSDYSEAYAYDSLARLSTRSIAIPSMGTYTYTWQYSQSTGWLDTLTYPVGASGQSLKLQYGYQNGILQSITDVLDSPNVTIWQADAESPDGQIAQETLGNGLVTNRTYDEVTHWLSSVQSGPGGGTSIQNQSFLYDEVGNVKQRQENNLGLTEDVYYDNDNRLSYSKLNGTQNLSLTYDQMGDITSKSDVGNGETWTYDPTHVHQVTEAGSTSFKYAYDANGNMTSWKGNAITWTSYNYPLHIPGSSSTETYTYGPDRTPWLDAFTSSGATTNTYNLGEMMSIVVGGGVTTYRHYIYAGQEPVAIDARTSSSNTFYYLLTDHQGSIAGITNPSGQVVVNESFHPYGNRRNPSTWTDPISNADLNTIAGITPRGYTFKPTLEYMGLNDLGGRVEDAVTGRFLSPDPTLQDPEDPQDYNAYSYVLNNPLTYVDPTGFDCQWVPQTADITPGEVPVANQDNSSGELVCTATGTPLPGGCPECDYVPEPQLPPIGPGPSTFPAPSGPTPGQPSPSPAPPQRPDRPQTSSPQQTTHHYSFSVFTLCSNTDAMQSLMSPGASAPGAPQAQNGTTTMTLPPLASLWGGGGQSFLPSAFFTPNPIQQTVSSSDGSIDNTALQGHIFFPGSANTNVTPTGVGSMVQTAGNGGGSYPFLNDFLGFAFFGLRNLALAYGCNLGSGSPPVN